jgi:enediyne biosynthesis protein E4
MSSFSSMIDHPPRRIALAWFLLSLAGAFVLAGCEPVSSRSLPPAAPPAAASPSIRFENVAVAAGLRYRWPEQPRPMRNLEAIGAGCAFLDYDNDGWQDILLVGKPHPVLFHNNGGGRFEEASQVTGLSVHQADWKGCAVGDCDGDGFLDLLLTGYRRLALLKNEGGRRWTNVTAAAGLDPQNRSHWGSSAGFMDLNRDGALDLVLLNYVVFGPKEKQYCILGRGVRSGCPPQEYRPEYGELWRNLGSGRFKDVTGPSGMENTHGKGLVLAFSDVDGDERIDFYLGNDGTPADLMLSLGGMRFRNVGLSSGVAYGAIRGHAMAAMGADWSDYDRDGRLDLTVTGFSDEAYALFRNLGRGQFEHAGDRTGITGPTYKPLGFGANWLDFDNDGWPDIAFANGHVYDNIEQIDPLSTFRQPLMLFHNQKGREFRDLVPELGGEVAKPIVGRGSATGDYDNDGRMDLLVVDYEGEPLLLHNQSQTPNHWLTLDLRSNGPNRFAYGARVTARAGKQVWVAEVSPASSYLSSSDPRLHFGLGEVVSLDSLTIRWPSGRTQVLRDIRGDRILRIQEGERLTAL